MDVKLTLKLNQEIIERAKQYARENNVSLSKLIEGYLSGLTDSGDSKNTHSPLVNSLTGVIQVPDHPDVKETKLLKNKMK